MEGKTEPASGPSEGPPPAPADAALLGLADRHLLGNYRPARIVLERGRGTEVFDVQGRRYLDFCAGVAVCCLGHAHPELSRAIADQAARLMHVSNYFYSVENVRLAHELCSATGFDRAFFCNSGAEANEALLKLARRYFYETGEPERIRIVCFERAFHGRTMGALTMTGSEVYLRGFGQPLAGIVHVPYGDLDAVGAVMDKDVAAVLVEPVQGEGGVYPAPAGFLTGLRELCDRHGALLLIDEVQVGMGRTGKLLGAEHWGVRADAIALAKGLGGGFPIGAMLLRERLAGGLPPGSHGSTFGGNPLASTAARTVLRILQRDGLTERAARLGKRLSEGLSRVASKHPKLCRGERGLGLLRAITLTDAVQARDLLEPMRAQGVLLTAAGARALRFTPPLIVTEEEIDEVLERVDAAFTAFA
ncbi:MAG TPA: aspartate aminotransferase family protein [Polyangiaceae bacterium]|nr:aspartate aminotransferase family protein [Polyangiaceae bacterium]